MFKFSRAQSILTRWQSDYADDVVINTEQGFGVGQVACISFQNVDSKSRPCEISRYLYRINKAVFSQITVSPSLTAGIPIAAPVGSSIDPRVGQLGIALLVQGTPSGGPLFLDSLIDNAQSADSGVVGLGPIILLPPGFFFNAFATSGNPLSMGLTIWGQFTQRS